MKNRKASIFLRICTFTAIGAGVLVASPALATSGIISGGNIDLWQNHYGTVELTSDWSYLDCHGYTIYDSSQSNVCWHSSDSTVECGVHVEADYVDIKNCNVVGFDVGINVINSTGTWIYHNALSVNVEGMRNDSSSYTKLYTSGIYYGGQGISGRDSDHFDFYDASVYWVGGDGMDINRAYRLDIWDVTFRDNTDHNVEVDDSDYVAFIDNTIDGKRTSDSVNQQTARDNLQLQDTDHITVEGNNIYDAGRHGIYIRDVDSGTVSNNYVTNSGLVDSSGADCRNRTSDVDYSGNSFGTVYNSGTCGQ